MKFYIKLIPIFLASLVSYSNAKDVNDEEVSNLSLKCYVELADGDRTVSFWYSKQTDIEKFSLDILDSKVPNSHDVDRAIVKVYQCIEEGKEFSDSRARVIEKNQIR